MDILWANQKQPTHDLKPVDHLALKVVQLLFLQLCLIVSSVLNGIIAFVLVFRNRDRRGGSVFVGSLTSMNFILSILLIPTSIIGAAEDDWPFGQSACSFIAFVQLLQLISSNQTLALIAVDRYMAIVRPMSYQKRVTKVRSVLLVGTCWLVSLILSLPPFWGWSKFAYHPHVYVCSVLWNQHPVYSVFVLVVVYAIPLVVMSLAYLNVYWAAKLQDRSINLKVEREHVPLIDSKKQKRFFSKLPWITVTYNTPQRAKRTIFLLLGSFQLFWTIYSIWMILEFFGFHYSEVAFLAFFANVLVVTITPILYGLLNQTIRKQVRRTFCRRRRRQPLNDENEDANSTTSFASFLDYLPRKRASSFGVESSELIKMDRSLSRSRFVHSLSKTFSSPSKSPRRRMKKSGTAPAGINITVNPTVSARCRLLSAPDIVPRVVGPPVSEPTSPMSDGTVTSTSSTPSSEPHEPVLDPDPESPV